MKKISICIPTYNRAKHLKNCLHSIILNKDYSPQDFQVCISDNASTDETQKVVSLAKEKIDLTYKRNEKNLGIPMNFLNVVDMADGEFIWLIGDDDLLLPNSLTRLKQLIIQNTGVDFFYVNSFHLTTEYVLSYPQPFDTKNLPTSMEKFSKWPHEGELPFLDLVNPKISFDFLGGMFLSVFRKENWSRNAGILDKDALLDNRTFSHFDNTFPHVKIFSKAFSNSRAYFNPNPLNVCLTGAREWAPMSNFMKSVRLVEALEEYRNNGLPYYTYLKCKNFALRTFIPNFVYMILHRDTSGYEYIKPWKLIVNNCLFPNFYLSLVFYCFSKLKYFLIGKY